MAPCRLGWKLRPGLVPTRASQLMAAVLLHYGLYLREFESLVSFWLRCLLAGLGVQMSAAFLANIGIMVMHPVHLLNGEQFPLVSLMAFLASWRTTGFFLFDSLHLRAIG